MTESKTETIQVRQILESWPLISIFGLGAALAFNSGYFTKPIGFSVFSVSVEDLAKSAIYALILVVILQNVFYLYEDVARKIDGKFSKSIAITLGLVGIFLTPILALKAAVASDDTSRIYFEISSILVRLGATAFAVGLLLFRFQKRSLLNLEAWIFATAITFMICYLFGRMMFFGDIENPRESKINLEGHTDSGMLMISERTSFYMFFHSKTCSYVFIEKSKMTSVEFRALDKLDSKRGEVDKCLAASGFF